MASSEKSYWLKDPILYSPLRVIQHYATHLDILPADQKKTKAFKKADEMLVGAIALLGFQANTSESYWIQAVPDSESSPDVRTGRWLPAIGANAPFFETQDVEIVGFVPKPEEDLVSFLERTKLSKEKAYDSKTTVLCHMQKGAHIPSLRAITEALRGTGAVCPVVILGRTDPKKKDYSLFQIRPEFRRSLTIMWTIFLNTSPKQAF